MRSPHMLPPASMEKNCSSAFILPSLKKKTKVASKESVTTATTTTVHQKHQMRRWKEVKKVLKEAEKVVVFTSCLTKAVRDTRRHSNQHWCSFQLKSFLL